ncbi:MAG: manganese efflux pump MntP family protein [Bacteroidales bacterium]
MILISMGLSLDTFAVSVSCGIKEKNIQFYEATRIALFFAFFQATMPIVGWLLGSSVSHYIKSVDHWLAFGLLTIIGIKIILDAWNRNEQEPCINIYDLKVILSLSLATTLDAFVIGFTFAFLDARLTLTILIIGFTTYVFAMLGMLFGKKLGHRTGSKIEMLGGVILIGIALKILLEHLQH